MKSFLLVYGVYRSRFTRRIAAQSLAPCMSRSAASPCPLSLHYMGTVISIAIGLCDRKSRRFICCQYPHLVTMYMMISRTILH